MSENFGLLPKGGTEGKKFEDQTFINHRQLWINRVVKNNIKGRVQMF